MNKKPATLYSRVRRILESARASAARSVNTHQVIANWLVGQEIVEEEQAGKQRADYGERVILQLSARLQRTFGDGYSATNLKLFRKFFLTYPDLVTTRKGHTPRDLLANGPEIAETISPPSGHAAAIGHTVCDQSWQPGSFHPNLAWSIYRQLLKIDAADVRAFYEIETLHQCWSARELERQIASLLFERLAKSRDKTGVRRLAAKGHDIVTPEDIFKDPVVIEFLGLPESHRLAESDVEEALLGQLQSFLLELGKGFAFVARQQRLTLDGDHFYIDLVFYHIVLKCYVLLDLKVGKLTHADLGQLQLYVNYFDREKRCENDNPTLGLILCTDKNDAVVKYTLGAEAGRKIFASRYKLHLPSEAELKAEVRRELGQFQLSKAEK